MKRATNNDEVHLIKLITQLYESSEYWIGEEIVTANKGVCQGSILAPNLFAIVLESVLYEHPILKAAID